MGRHLGKGCELAGTDIDLRGEPPETPVGAGRASRVRRLIHGWSANLVQIFLGLVQQLLLIPVFLHFWTSDVLAAWLAIYAAGVLTVVADAGLQLRAINRFLGFKSSVDCDGRTANYYSGILKIYVVVVIVLAVLLSAATVAVPPSRVLGFEAVPTFDSAWQVMTLGVLLALPANLVSGLYRTRDRYSRAVWLQNLAALLGQVLQLIAVVVFGNLLAVTLALVSTQVLYAAFLVLFDAPHLFPHLRRIHRRWSWRWSAGQFRLAFGFALVNFSELALLNAPVLLVSAFVTDRIAVAQWGLTRVVAGLVRGVSWQAALPIAAELGHDYAIGQKEKLRQTYAFGSALVVVLASLMVSGLLPFWSEFFTLWTRGNIPYDGPLAITLLAGCAVIAPSLLALAFASHSNRTDLLVRTKGLQLLVFAVLSFVFIPTLGPIGAALAVVVSDGAVQFGLLTVIIVSQTLKHPVRHLVFLLVSTATIVLLGWSLGAVINWALPGDSILLFLVRVAAWLLVVCAAAGVLIFRPIRARLVAFVPM